MAAFANYYGIPNRINPITTEIKTLVKALVKTQTKRPAGRTKIMTIEPFRKLFESWGQNNTLSLSKLRQKAITLMTIATMARPSDIAPIVGLSRDQITFNDDNSATILFFGTKTDHARQGFEVRIEGTGDELSDPIRCLQCYCERTAVAAQGVDNVLFLTLTKPFKALSSRGVACVLNESITDAGLSRELFSAKSFRPSAATAAVLTGCDPNVTRLRGRWKNETVFYNNYVYPISEVNISEKMLKSSVVLTK